LLTNLPECLHSTKALRDWMQSCGSARSVHMVPRPTSDQKPEEESKRTALVTLSHADAALRFMTAFRHFQKVSNTNIQAYFVPINPEVPLPPAVMDASSVTTLGEKLQATLETLQTTDISQYSESQQTDDNSKQEKVTLEDAGGTYDEEQEDPLQQPHVLAAVRAFRQRLEQQQGSKAVRRKELVQSKLQALLPVMRERIQDEKNNPPLGVLPPLPPGNNNLPPPPGNLLPPPPPPPPGELPPFPPPPPQANQPPEEPPAKRVKLDTSQAFPTLPATKRDELRQFISQSIQHYVGEPEQTLIDFCLQHVLDQKSGQELLPELEEVLEEDANSFLQGLWDKVQELKE